MFYQPGGTGHNLAPFSQFQNLTFDPPYVMLAANQTTQCKPKDPIEKLEQTGEFVWNMATYELQEAVNISGQEVPPEADEFEIAGVTKKEGNLVQVPMVAESPIHFECKYHSTLRLPGNGHMGTVNVVIGEMIVIHISDQALTDDGLVDVLNLIARMGYYDCTSVESIFQMVILNLNKELRRGMEGKQSAETSDA